MTRAYIHDLNSGGIHAVEVGLDLTAESLLKRLKLSGELRNSYGSVLAKSANISSFLVEDNDLYLEETSSSVSVSSLVRPIESFSWTDEGGDFVTVRLSARSPQDVQCVFEERSFQVSLVSLGQRFRFRCGRTHGLLDGGGCSWRVSGTGGGAVVLKLKKLHGKSDGQWFDLFKKKAVGDTDAV